MVVPFKRSERVNDMVRMEVADILLRKAKDPRVGFVTVTGAEVSEDLQHAKIYVSILQGSDQKQVLAALARASGFVRAELGKRLSLRYTPELLFLPDHAYRKAEHVLHLLESLEKGEKPPS